MAKVHYTSEQVNERFSFTGKFRTTVITLLVVGIISLLLGVYLTQHPMSPAHGHGGETAVTEHPVEAGHGGGHGEHAVTWKTRFLADFLLANMFYFRIALGSFVFLMFTWLGGGGWNTVIRRISEAMSQYIYVAFGGFIILFFFMNDIYEWVRVPVGQDELIDAKRSYLNPSFFMVRSLIYFTIWGTFIYLVRRASLREDMEGGLDTYKKTTRFAAAFIVLFAFSYTLFSFDWLKSLEPHWFSTIYGVYVFAGTMVTAMTTLYLMIITLKRGGYLAYVNDSHLHDVGKYMFGFSIFWAYIWVSQFLLIWYSNVPEETIYYIKRIGGYNVLLGGKSWFETYQEAPQYLGYAFFYFFCLIANFITPFLVLMTRNAKRTPVVVYPLIFLMLAGHWTDLYQLIMPGTVGRYTGDFGNMLMQIGFLLSFGGLFLGVVYRSLAKAPMVPKNNPFLEESLHHSTGAI